ncbi:MAG: hypothetical protein WB989_21325, partial [Mycobacterium sp.]
HSRARPVREPVPLTLTVRPPAHAPARPCNESPL